MLPLKSLLLLAVASSALIGLNTTYAHGKHGASKFIEIFDTNKDGKVTLDEFNANITERFKKMDANNDGSVSKEEFDNYVASRRQEYTSRFMGKVDADKNGQLSQEEFLEAAKLRALAKFKKLDANSDGKLTPDELSGGKMGRHGKHHGGQKVFSKIDTNNDGKISLEESIAASSKWFKRKDKNSDNVVTPDEMESK